MPDKPTKAQQTLDRILDAALACYEEKGISATRLEDVARSADIGRTTLYRYVDNRDDLLAKVLYRDARQQSAEMEVLTRYQDRLGDMLVDSVVHVMRGRRNRPINRLLFGGGEEAVIERINISPANFRGMASEMLAPAFEQARARGELREGVTLEQAGDWLARMILSLVTYPGDFLEDEQALRAYLWQFLVPSLLRDS